MEEGGFITVYTDITEQRQNERLIQERNEELEARVQHRTEELRAANARLELITDAVPAGIAFIDAAGNYRFANQRVAQAFGLSKEEIIGRAVDSIEGNDLLQLMAPFMERIRQGQQVTLDHETSLPNGQRAEIRTMVIPDLRDDGEILGYYALSLDVSDQKKAEAALLQAQRMESVAKLSGGLAHDFNNLLTILLGNLVPLQERCQPRPEDLALIDPAIEAARRGANLIGRLLTFSRQQPLKPVPVDVKGLIDNLVDSCCAAACLTTSRSSRRPKTVRSRSSSTPISWRTRSSTSPSTPAMPCPTAAGSPFPRPAACG